MPSKIWTNLKRSLSLNYIFKNKFQLQEQIVIKIAIITQVFSFARQNIGYPFFNFLTHKDIVKDYITISRCVRTEQQCYPILCRLSQGWTIKIKILCRILFQSRARFHLHYILVQVCINRQQ